PKRVDSMPCASSETDRIIKAFGGDIDAVVVCRKAQIDERMPSLEVRQPRQEPADSKCAHGPYPENLAIVAPFEIFQRSRDTIEGIAQRRQQRLAFPRQHQSTRKPVEQRDIQTAFEALYLMAHCGLGHA